MLRCMLGSVKSENPKEEGEIGKWKEGVQKILRIN